MKKERKERMFSLKGKVAVVTGGGSGLGLATVKRFVAAGATVVMADKRDCSQLAEEIGCTFIQTDVTKEEQVERLMKTAAELFGPLDIVINNAGIIMPEQRIDDAVIEDYETLFRVNALGVLLGIKYGARYMKDGGAIVNTASNSANGDFSGYGAYIASKCAVVGITKAAALFHFLVSDDCKYITGEDIYIDGGMKAGHGDNKIMFILDGLMKEKNL